MRNTILPPDWQLPAEILGRLGTTVGRQRAMFADDHLLLLLHAPPEPGKPERESRLFWRDPLGAWRSSWPGTRAQALAEHLRDYATRIDGLEERLEKHRTSQHLFRILRAATPLQRATRHLHATLQEAREMLDEDQVVIDARDAASGLVRAIELLHSETKNALDYEMAQQGELRTRVSHEMNVSAHRLNVLAAVFLPLVTLTGIFGMNLDSGIKAGLGEYAFWTVLVVGILIGLCLYAALGRRRAA